MAATARGKSTLLNLIGDKLDLERRSPYNRAAFFRDFVKLCQCEGAQRCPWAARSSPVMTFLTTC